MDDGDAEALGQVRGEEGRARFIGVGGKANLVVGDDVDRPAGLVAWQAVHVQRFCHHPLPGKGRVAVDEDGQRDRRVEDRRAGLVGAGARGARHAFDHRVDRLQVAGVGRHLDGQLEGVRWGVIRALSLVIVKDKLRPGVILDIALPGQPYCARRPVHFAARAGAAGL